MTAIVTLGVLITVFGVGLAYTMYRFLMDAEQELMLQQDDIAKLVKAIDKLPNPPTRSEVSGLKAFAAYVIDSQIIDVRNQFDV